MTLDANDNTNFHVKTTADFNVNRNAVKIANKEYLNYDSGVYNVIGISEYQSFNNNRNDDDDKYYTIIQLIHVDDGYDYYISFASASSSFTSDYSKDNLIANRVLVTKRLSGFYYSDSILVGTLKGRYSYNIYGFNNNGNTLAIEPALFLEQPPYAIATFTLLDYCEDDTDCDDFNSCTNDWCSVNGKCIFETIDCNTCGALVSISIITTNPQSPSFKDLLSWYIQNSNTDQILLSTSGSQHLSIRNNTESYYNTTTSYCIEYGTYITRFIYEEESEDDDNIVNYTVTVGTEVVESDSTSNYLSDDEYLGVETLFIICSSNDDCIDYNGCTYDYCNIDTNLCNNTSYSNDDSCSNCTWLEFNLTLDNFPDETLWDIEKIDTVNSNNNILVLDGNPYSSDVMQYGRKKKNSRKKKNARILASLSSTTTDTDINERICLENNNLYQYTITDDFGDG